jgi:hypothetical protein
MSSVTLTPGSPSAVISASKIRLVDIDIVSDGTGEVKVYAGSGLLAFTVKMDNYAKIRKEAVNRLMHPTIFAEISGGISRATFNMRPPAPYES